LKGVVVTTEKAEAKKTRRVQMELSEDSFARLQKVKEMSEASSYTDVVKDALRLYEYVLNNEIDGTKFMLEDNKGRVTAVKIFA